MKSKWYGLKDQAIKLRKSGKSIRDVEKELGIARSTLSGWFYDIELSDPQKKELNKRYQSALVKARKAAAVVHNTHKIERIQKAKSEAEKVMENIELNDNSLELALAMLYWGEGRKKGSTTIGSADQTLLKFVITAMKILYSVERDQVKCYVHGRADHEPKELITYWSEALNIPKQRFGKVVLDKRTRGEKTINGYMGVCSLEYGNVAIQRRLKYLYNLYSDKIINDSWARSSAG